MASDPLQPDAESLARQTDRMRGLARGLLRDYDRAEDVVQETTLRALTGRVRPRTTLAACLSGVVRNVAQKVRRGDQRRDAHEFRAAKRGHAPSTADLLARLDTHRLVLKAVRGLTEPYRGAILMRYIDGLPPREIATRLAVPLQTVKSWLKRGLAQLRERLDAGHAGNRQAWLGALLPVAGWEHLLIAPGSAAAATTGGLMAHTTSNKLALAAAAALALGFGAWWATDGFGSMNDDAPPPKTVADGGATPDLQGARLAGRGEGAMSSEAGAAPDASTPPAKVEPEATPEPKPTPVASNGRAPSTLPPVRHSPYGPPRPRGTPRDAKGKPLPMGGRGLGGPTGHWTRFRLDRPPLGTARLEVRVVDEHGNAVENAKVYLGPEDVKGRAAVSCGSLRDLGVTDAKGILRHATLTPGTVAVCANVGSLLTRRYGLDTNSAELTTLENGVGRRVSITLPLSTKTLGSIRGTVKDPHGQPLFGVQVKYEKNWVRTGRDGTYALLRIPSGPQTIRFESWSFEGVSKVVEVRALGRTTQNLTLKFKEEGSLTVSGHVVGPKDEFIKGCNVYLNVHGDNATARSTRTNADGFFEFKQLPDRFSKEAVEVQASGIPRYGSTRIQFDKGVPNGQDVQLKIDVRFISVIFDIRESGTGEIVRMASASARSLDDPNRRKGHFSYYKRHEGYQGILEPGRYHVTIEGLDHKTVEFDLDVPHEAPFRHKVRLIRTSPDSVPVHLTLDIFGATEQDQVTQTKIEVFDLAGRKLSGFEGSRAQGRYLLPVPSGKRKLVITADGYDPYSEVLDLDPAEIDVTHAVHLRAK